MIVYAVVDDTFSPDFPLGDAVETFIRREEAERFIEEVRGDEPETTEAEDRGAGGRGGRAELESERLQISQRSSMLRTVFEPLFEKKHHEFPSPARSNALTSFVTTQLGIEHISLSGLIHKIVVVTTSDPAGAAIDNLGFTF